MGAFTRECDKMLYQIFLFLFQMSQAEVSELKLTHSGLCSPVFHSYLYLKQKPEYVSFLNFIIILIFLEEIVELISILIANSYFRLSFSYRFLWCYYFYLTEEEAEAKAILNRNPNHEYGKL